MMNNEYLWNKTGNDTEIEALENALNSYRYKETAAPALPAKVFALPERAPRRFFRLSFGFAAAAFATVILTIVWLQMPGKPVRPSDSPNIVIAQADSAVNQHEAFPPGKIEVPLPVAKRNVVKVRETNHLKIRPIKTIAQRVKNTNPPIKLTKEEEYAYDQLMLALSITSSKLKIVKDKLDGIDEQNAVVEKQR